MLSIYSIITSIIGNNPQLTMIITATTFPDAKEVKELAEENLSKVLSSDEALVSQTLSDKIGTKLNLTNTRLECVKVDVILRDISSLDYLKELSDKMVLTNIMDMILMTPEFIESCQAEDVAITAVLDKESYQQIKDIHSKYNVDFVLLHKI